MSGYDLSTLRCLLVEDHPQMRRLLRELLRAIGLRDIEEAEAGADALEKLSLSPFDIIVCDYMMEPIDGLELARFVRTAQDSEDPRTPIIMVTSYTSRRTIFAARDAGVNEVVVKPISPADLYTRIYAIVERPRKFVRSPNYVGPDRRRRVLADTGERRRWDDEADADVFDLGA